MPLYLTRMKEHSFFGKNENYLYTYNSKKVDGARVYIITGRSHENIEVGDVIKISKEEWFQVTSIEWRDHKGVFKDQDKAEKSFFTATCTGEITSTGQTSIE